MHILLLLLSLTSSLTLWAQSDPAIKAIKFNTQTTAENTAKGGFDYITLTISLLAFLIACVTLYYSIKTYRSQKKTESNTTKFSAKQERIELRNLGVQLINNAAALFVAEQMQTADNNLYMNSQLYEGMLIDIDRLHTDTFMGPGIDHSSLYEFSILVHKYNDRLRLRKRMAECRMKKPETVKIGEEYLRCQFHQEMEMTWTLFKRLSHLYNDGMLTDEERKVLIPGAQEAELPTYTAEEAQWIEQVFNKLAHQATYAQQCAIETDFSFPYRVHLKTWPEAPYQVSTQTAELQPEKIYFHLLLTDESEEGKALHDAFMYSVMCELSKAHSREYVLIEERQSAKSSLITSYVFTREGEFYDNIQPIYFRLILDGTKKDIDLPVYLDDVRNMIKIENFTTLSEDNILNAMEPDEPYTFTGDDLHPLSTLVLTTTLSGMLHTLRAEVHGHRLDFVKTLKEDTQDRYCLHITLHLETSHILSYQRLPFDEERYHIIENT